MEPTRRFVFGVDLDGVCADFYGGLRPIAAEWLGVDVGSLPERVSYGLPEWGIDKAPGGYELRILSAADIRIRIITHRLFIRYFHRTAARQTLKWLDHHDIPYWDLCSVKDKSAVGADLYFEDAPANIAALRGDGLSTIVFTNSTNEGLADPRVDTWEQVIDLVLAESERWGHTVV